MKKPKDSSAETVRPLITAEKAAALIEQHELTFLDVCQLVLVFADRTDAMIKWEHSRVVVHIKKRPRVRPLGASAGGRRR